MTLKIFLFGGLGLFLLIGLISGGNKSEPKPSVANIKEVLPTLSDAECRKDLHCWGEKNDVDASAYVKDIVSRQAKYQAEWTDTWYESKVSRYGWADRDKGLLRFAGDKVKFQNRFGAWSPMTYQFTYNPDTKQITDLVIEEGRLPN